MGPTGREKQRLGRGCVCWGCGHVGLPRNADAVSPKVWSHPNRLTPARPNPNPNPTPNPAKAGVAEPAGVCAACGDGGATNFVTVVDPRGATVPWIEAAPTPPEAAGAEAAAAAAAGAAEVAEAGVATAAAEDQAEEDGRGRGDARSGRENVRSAAP